MFIGGPTPGDVGITTKANDNFSGIIIDSKTKEDFVFWIGINAKVLLFKEGEKALIELENLQEPFEHLNERIFEVKTNDALQILEI